MDSMKQTPESEGVLKKKKKNLIASLFQKSKTKSKKTEPASDVANDAHGLTANHHSQSTTCDPVTSHRPTKSGNKHVNFFRLSSSKRSSALEPPLSAPPRQRDTPPDDTRGSNHNVLNNNDKVNETDMQIEAPSYSRRSSHSSGFDEISTSITECSCNVEQTKSVQPADADITTKPPSTFNGAECDTNSLNTLLHADVTTCDVTIEAEDDAQSVLENNTTLDETPVAFTLHESRIQPLAETLGLRATLPWSSLDSDLTKSSSPAAVSTATRDTGTTTSLNSIISNMTPSSGLPAVPVLCNAVSTSSSAPTDIRTSRSLDVPIITRTIPSVTVSPPPTTTDGPSVVTADVTPTRSTITTDTTSSVKSTVTDASGVPSHSTSVAATSEATGSSWSDLPSVSDSLSASLLKLREVSARINAVRPAEAKAARRTQAAARPNSFTFNSAFRNMLASELSRSSTQNLSTSPEPTALKQLASKWHQPSRPVGNKTTAPVVPRLGTTNNLASEHIKSPPIEQTHGIVRHSSNAAYGRVQRGGTISRTPTFSSASAYHRPDANDDARSCVSINDATSSVLLDNSKAEPRRYSSAFDLKELKRDSTINGLEREKKMLQRRLDVNSLGDRVARHASDVHLNTRTPLDRVPQTAMGVWTQSIDQLDRSHRESRDSLISHVTQSNRRLDSSMTSISSNSASRTPRRNRAMSDRYVELSQSFDRWREQLEEAANSPQQDPLGAIPEAASPPWSPPHDSNQTTKNQRYFGYQATSYNHGSSVDELLQKRINSSVSSSSSSPTNSEPPQLRGFAKTTPTQRRVTYERSYSSPAAETYTDPHPGMPRTAMARINWDGKLKPILKNK